MPSGIDVFYIELILLAIGDLVGQFHNIYFDLILIMILFIGWCLTKRWIKKFSTKLVDFLKKPIPVYVLFLILVGQIALIFLFIPFNPSQLPRYGDNDPTKIPPFEIVEPKDGDDVNYRSTVSGHGAISGSLVKVYVVDKYTKTYSQGTAYPAENGNWTCSGLQIGQYGSQSAGQSFTVFANYTKDNISSETPHINVTRS
jgi:hypothetical protein